MDSKELIQAFFNFLNSTNQIQKINFQNTSKYKHKLISEEIGSWQVSANIISFELDHNKFKVKASESFLTKIITAPSLQSLTLKGCQFEEHQFNLLIELLQTQIETIIDLEISKIRLWEQFGTLEEEQKKEYFKKLAQSINSQKKLKNLNLKENENCQYLFKYILEGTYTLQTLNLSQCFLKDIDIHYLQDSFLNCKSLDFLELSQNQLKYESGVILGKILKLRPKLIKKLFLNNNQIRAEGFEEIIKGIAEGKSVLSELDVGQNQIEIETPLPHLSAILKRGYLQNIILSHNRLSERSCQILNEAFRDVEYKTFEKLILMTNKEIKQNGASHISQIIEHSKNMYVCDLILCGIEDQGGIEIAKALKKNTVLNYLLLGWNPITCITAKALADSLKINQTLQNIQLHNCNIGQEGALALAEMLQVNQSLFRLILKSNPIGNEGCQEILKSLRYNKSLRVINLQDCQLASIKQVGIYNSLTENTTLTVLWLPDNQLDIGTGEVISYILTKNKTLRWINLQGNNLTDSDAEQIATGLRENKTLEQITLSCNQITDLGKRALKISRELSKLKSKIDI